MCPPPCEDCGYLDCICEVGCGDCGTCEDCNPTVGCEDCKECGCADCFPPDGNCGTCEVCNPTTPPCECGTCDECDPPCSTPHYPGECDVPGCPNATLTVYPNITVGTGVGAKPIVVYWDGVGYRDASQTIGNIRNAFGAITDPILKNRIHTVRVLPTNNNNIIRDDVNNQYDIGIRYGANVQEINNFLADIIRGLRKFTIEKTLTFASYTHNPDPITDTYNITVIDKTGGNETLKEQGVISRLEEMYALIPNLGALIGDDPLTMNARRHTVNALRRQIVMHIEQDDSRFPEAIDIIDRQTMRNFIHGLTFPIENAPGLIPFLAGRLQFALEDMSIDFTMKEQTQDVRVVGLPQGDSVAALTAKKIAPALNNLAIRQQNAVAQQS